MACRLYEPVRAGSPSGRPTRAGVREVQVHTIPVVDAFLIVDFQNDFTPGGALPVAEGDEIAKSINTLLDSFDLVIATRDWHCPDHGSFAGVKVDSEKWRGADPPSIWPVHCVEGTPGAELHPDLEQEKVDVVIDKGQDPNSQGYSGFQDTQLGRLLRERGVDHLFVAGLATDYCVKNTVLDARHEGFDVTVVEDAVRGVEVEPGDSERALEEMERAGAHLASSDEILAERA
jgi:nicotinamidase/pyrazinamidase